MGSRIESIAVLSHQLASTTDGGDFNSGAKRTVTLNTEEFDADNIVTLSANQFTLQAGEYQIRAYSTANDVAAHKTYLANITDATDQVGAQGSSTGNRPNYQPAVWRVSIDSAKAFELQHECNTTQAGDGFGNSADLDTEHYATVVIYKLGAEQSDSWAVICEQQTSGTDAGSFSSGARRTRVLNTEVTDPDGIVIISSNQFALGAGTYEVVAFAPGVFVNRHQAYLYNVTDAADEAKGCSTYAPPSPNFVANKSVIHCAFTTDTSKAFEIQHECQTTRSGNGLGASAGFGTEQYATVYIRKADGYQAADEFQTTWETTSPSESITIPTTGAGYLCEVDWGDGNSDIYSGTAPTISHTYATAGTHTVKIKGVFPRIYFNNGGDKTKIRTVEQWGEVGATAMNDAFEGCTGLTSIAANGWNVANWQFAFKGCTALTDPNDVLVGVTAATTLNYMFEDSGVTQTANISDCASVTQAQAMYKNAPLVTVNAGDYDSLTSMTTMNNHFENCDMTSLPSGAFDGLTAVTTIRQMFKGCTSLTATPASLFSLSTSLADAEFAFEGCSALATIGASLFDNCPLTKLSGTFKNAAVTSIDFGTWDWTGITGVNAQQFLLGCTVGTTDYNASMIGVEAQAVNNSVTFGGGNSVATGSGLTARNALISDHTWSITDNS